MGELIVFGIVFVFLAWLVMALIEGLLKFMEHAAVNFISTILVVGGIILGLGLLAGEASAAVALAIPASTAVAKMRLATGGF